MNIYQSLYPHLDALGLNHWSRQLQQTLPPMFAADSRREMAEWRKVLQSLPRLKPDRVELQDRVEIGGAGQLDMAGRTALAAQLKTFLPWRKGPFQLFGVDIDTEWRSDWKWDRLLPHIQPLNGRRVLDVGCGNGYHGWRMRGAGAALVLGIDPVMMYVMQFLVMQHFLDDDRHHLLPLRMEDLPKEMNCFDTVFSMGVLYHRRAPLEHLRELKGCLRGGGELVLETLIVEAEDRQVFTPQGRYAKMRNVWAIPSVAALSTWLDEAGFDRIACVDVNRTSIAEQRRTDWMWDESLADYLDPQDSTRTIEGHPAPLRAIFVARKP